MRIIDPILQRPWTPTGEVDPLPQRQRRVLMPNHKPIRGRGFVEQSRAKRERIRSQDSSRQFDHLWFVSQRCHRVKA